LTHFEKVKKSCSISPKICLGKDESFDSNAFIFKLAKLVVISYKQNNYKEIKKIVFPVIEKQFLTSRKKFKKIKFLN